MARVTVQDCIEKVAKYELSILAAERVKSIEAGELITVDRDNDKNPVIALREIAMGNIDVDALRESLVTRLEKSNRMDIDPEENLYAEAQEPIGEDANYSASDKEDNLFLDDMDFSAEDGVLDFSDNVLEEDEK